MRLVDGPTDFFFEWSLAELGIVQGDVLEYWFEVWDNDRIHDLKWRDLPLAPLPPPSELDIREERDQANADIEQNRCGKRARRRTARGNGGAPPAAGRRLGDRLEG